MDEPTDLKTKNLFPVRQPSSEIDFYKKNIKAVEKIEVKGSTKGTKEVMSTKGETEFKPKTYKVEHVELPKSIQKFDQKPKSNAWNPYDYNTIALRKKAVHPEQVNLSPTQTASDMIIDPTYNSIGKFLGVDTVHDWDKYYDKVYAIVEWAKLKTGNDVNKIMRWLGEKSRTLPSIGTKTIDNLYIFAKMKLEEANVN